MPVSRWSWIVVSGLLLAGCLPGSDDLPTTFSSSSPTATETSLPTITSTTPPFLQAVGPGLVADGRTIFEQTCASCHGMGGVGYANELGAPALDLSKHASDHSDQQIHEWIVNGKLGFGRRMPAFGNALDDRGGPRCYRLLSHLVDRRATEDAAGSVDPLACDPGANMDAAPLSHIKACNKR